MNEIENEQEHAEKLVLEEKNKNKWRLPEKVLVAVLVASLISNAWFVYLNIQMNNFMISFVTDVFYSYPSNVDPNVPVTNE